MQTVKIDFSVCTGKLKPMNGVNNGPMAESERGISNFRAYADLEIPYARNHDASFFEGYGGEHTVDVHRIFKNFDADENDPKSYVFEPTDEYTLNTFKAGTKVFYRLGASIEHGYKYGTYPPKDFHKWARICEHIIRHYNEGWNNGFNWNIEYWEIWNEPDGKPNWTGTPEQYYELYNITAKHLKETFPNIKVGGPALAFIDGKEWLENFIDSIEIKPDFFSWHIYISEDVNYFAETAKYVRELMDAKGWFDTELIINEWNYVKSFQTEEWKYSLKAMINLKGASFIAAVMGVCQYSVLDMLMYYDARPCGMNGLFSMYGYSPLKGYYVFEMFRDLYKLGHCASFSTDDVEVFGCAAANDKMSAMMFTYYCDDDEIKEKELKINVKDIAGADKICVKVYYLTENEDKKLRFEQIMTSDEFNLYLTVKTHETVYIECEKI